MPKIKSDRIYQYKSFYLTPIDKEQLAYLSSVYGQNQSAVIRRLITEAYTFLKYIEQK